MSRNPGEGRRGHSRAVLAHILRGVYSIVGRRARGVRPVSRAFYVPASEPQSGRDSVHPCRIGARRPTTARCVGERGGDNSRHRHVRAAARRHRAAPPAQWSLRKGACTCPKHRALLRVRGRGGYPRGPVLGGRGEEFRRLGEMGLWQWAQW